VTTPEAVAKTIHETRFTPFLEAPLPAIMGVPTRRSCRASRCGCSATRLY
jgi:hypothetical protein